MNTPVIRNANSQDSDDIANWTRTTCAYCGVGCGVLAQPQSDGSVAIKGDPEHPANFGRLCSKGSALGETVGLSERLLAPQVKGQTVNWDSALDLVAEQFSKSIAEHGPDSVAFYVSGQLLTEDYYVANKLMKGYIGSANIDTNSRLCMASSVAGHKRAFGTDTVPGTYEDIEAADVVVLVGSNLAWCHPVLYQRLLAARQTRGTKIIVIDPRRTASVESADLHLPLAIGSDVALFNHLLCEIDERGALNSEFLTHVEGLESALDAARADSLEPTGLDADLVKQFCDMWIGTERVVTIYSQGVNQSSAGADKVNAILNCHLATGRIGLPGTGPFSVTGQPNAMGGREVGGLANMLACHLDIENADHRDAVQAHWAAPTMATQQGLKAVDMFEAVHQDKIKALWIIHTNPAVSMPDADRVREAIKRCDFTVVSDITAQTDTARLADVVLPATGWGEKSGTVTNSDRTISRQRAFLPAPGQARPDWVILADVACRMGWKNAFNYNTEAEIFREYAALSGVAKDFGRDFDISALKTLSDAQYDDTAPLRWPQSGTETSQTSKERFFADGQFFHTSGKAKMLPLRHRPPAAKRAKKYPYYLNTGRLRDQWHTMTRTGLSPRLSSHLAEPFVDIHPHDAKDLGIQAADLVRLHSPHGQSILRARITRDVLPGDMFTPIHWTGETAPSACVDTLVAPVVDPVSGQPESKASVVAAQRFEAQWYGFAISRGLVHPNADYWARARTPRGWRLELASAQTPDDWEAEARRLFNLPDACVQRLEDKTRGSARIALYDNGILLAALFIAREPVAVMRDYLATLPGDQAENSVLSGRAPQDRPDPGPILCSCFSVGVNTILSAIETQGLMSVEAIGDALQAGTNCGSCRPEIGDLLARVQLKDAAE